MAHNIMWASGYLSVDYNTLTGMVDKGTTKLKLVGLAAWWDGKGEEHEWLKVHRMLLTDHDSVASFRR